MEIKIKEYIDEYPKLFHSVLGTLYMMGIGYIIEYMNPNMFSITLMIWLLVGMINSLVNVVINMDD